MARGVQNTAQDASLDSSANPSALDASQIVYTYTKSPRPVPEEATANSSDESVCTDHMICATWTADQGWSSPQFKPYGPLTLMPTASCLHYATECFEGMKLYRGYDGKLRVFRPDLNAARFLVSARRVSLPSFDPQQVEKLILKLAAVDGPKWLREERAGSFLYIRPAMIGTQAHIGARGSNQALLFIVMSFMPQMHLIPGGMRLLTSDDKVRAWAGGFGYAKIGANYGPTVVVLKEALDRGYNQVLWLYGPEGECTEAGGSNFFVIWKRRDGQAEIVTAPLDDQIILDGVTRRSCIELAKERLKNKIIVTERKFTIGDLVDAAGEGRLVEAFSTGTAVSPLLIHIRVHGRIADDSQYFVCPISHIHHRGREIYFPMGSDGRGGEITALLRQWLEEIMYGKVQHEWGKVVNEVSCDSEV